MTLTQCESRWCLNSLWMFLKKLKKKKKLTWGDLRCPTDQRVFMHLQGRLQKTCWAPYCVSAQVRFYLTHTAPPSLKPRARPGAWRSCPVTLVGSHLFWICLFCVSVICYCQHSSPNMCIRLFHSHVWLHMTGLNVCVLKKKQKTPHVLWLSGFSYLQWGEATVSSHALPCYIIAKYAHIYGFCLLGMYKIW